MKVFQVGHFYLSGSGMGVIEYMFQMTNQLHKEGIEVSFIQFDRDKEGILEEVVDGITILHFPKHRFMGMMISETFRNWLEKLIFVEKDVIFHLHSVFYLPNFFIAKILRQKQISYIYTPHDSYSAESMQRNKLLKLVFLNTFDKPLMDGAKAIHAITPDGVKSISIYTSNRSIKLITNFVPQISYLNNPKIKKQLCFIGRMDIYQKGIDLMLEAFSKFIRNREDVVLILIGQYMKNEIKEFNKLMHKYKLTSAQVKVVGRVSNKEKYKILSESYAYIQLSRFEGFGLSIVEALSLGKPVIISPKVPISNVIKRNKAGYVAANANQACIALQEVFRLDNEGYTTIGNNALKCYQKNYTPEMITKQMIEMYEESVYGGIVNEEIIL